MIRFKPRNCLCTLLGLGLLIASIITAIATQEHVLSWMGNDPLKVVAVMWVIIVDSVAIVALLFNNSFFCPEAQNCPYTFKGLNDRRRKKRRE